MAMSKQFTVTIAASDGTVLASGLASTYDDIRRIMVKRLFEYQLENGLRPMEAYRFVADALHIHQDTVRGIIAGR
jgi:NADH:ubiquinone oxidoreductase subunit E